MLEWHDVSQELCWIVFFEVEVITDSSVDREGVVPPLTLDPSAQSSRRSAEDVYAIWAEEALKIAISKKVR